MLDVQIAAIGENSPLTCLVPDLKGISPDDAFSRVPYEKGHTLLFHLEELAGGPGKWNITTIKSVFKSVLLGFWTLSILQG